MVDLQEDEKSCYKAVVREGYRLAYGYHGSVYCPLDMPSNDLLSMRSQLARLGVNSNGVYIDDISSLPRKIILIAQVKRNEVEHFVLVRTINNEKVYLYDPEFGYIWVDMYEFKDMFTGRGLLLQKNKKKYLCKYDMPKIIKTWQTSVIGILALIRCITAVLFLYSFNKNCHWSISLSMILIFGLTIVGNFFFSEKIVKNYSKNVGIPLANVQNSIEPFKYSTLLITENLKIESNILNRMTLLFISFFIAINMNYLMGIMFANQLFLCFAIKLICNPFLSQGKSMISYEESKLATKRIDESSFDILWNKTMRYAFKNILVESSCAIFACILAFIYSYIEKSLSLDMFFNGAIFLFGTSSFLVKLIDDLNGYSKVRILLYKCGNTPISLEQNERKNDMILSKRD